MKDHGEDLTVLGFNANGKLVRVANHLRDQREAKAAAKELKSADDVVKTSVK
jgi:hypothetical protein